MRKFILVLILLTGNVMANAMKIGKYSLDAGRLHKGGNAQVEVLPDPDNYVVKLKYDINKKALVPIPNNILKGEKDFVLPKAFADEKGYQELEKKGSLEMDKAVVNFLRREKVANLPDAYLFEILPKNGKSRIEVAYHPTLPGVGWKYVKLKFLGNLPLLQGYETIAHLEV
jgi:hypothetical protein